MSLASAAARVSHIQSMIGYRARPVVADQEGLRAGLEAITGLRPDDDTAPAADLSALVRRGGTDDLGSDLAAGDDLSALVLRGGTDDLAAAVAAGDDPVAVLSAVLSQQQAALGLTTPSAAASPTVPVTTDATVGLAGPVADPLPGHEPGSGFGSRVDPFTGRPRHHAGVDIGAPTGTPIRSIGPGEVITAGESGGYGQLVVVDHGGGVQSRYAHQSSLAVAVGDRVVAGQVIGAVGSTGRSTGPHLHLEVRVDGEAVDPTPILEHAG